MSDAWRWLGCLRAAYCSAVCGSRRCTLRTVSLTSFDPPLSAPRQCLGTDTLSLALALAGATRGGGARRCAVPSGTTARARRSDRRPASPPRRSLSATRARARLLAQGTGAWLSAAAWGLTARYAARSQCRLEWQIRVCRSCGRRCPLVGGPVHSLSPLTPPPCGPPSRSAGCGVLAPCAATSAAPRSDQNQRTHRLARHRAL